MWWTGPHVWTAPSGSTCDERRFGIAALDADNQMIEPVETGNKYQRSVCASPSAQRESTESGFGAGVDDDVSGKGVPGETMRTTGILRLVLPRKANHPKGCHAEQLA